MAGKNIYIEKILDNLLGGIDTALGKMIAALEKMMGKTEEEEGSSLTDIVNKLDDVVGEDGSSLTDVVNKLDDVVGEDGKSLTNVVTELQNNSAEIIGIGGKSLTDVVNELQEVINAIAASVSDIMTKIGDEIINHINVTKTFTASLPTFKFYSYVDGSFSLNLHFSGTLKNNTSVNYGYIRIYDTNNTMMYEKAWEVAYAQTRTIDEDFTAALNGVRKFGQYTLKFEAGNTQTAFAGTLTFKDAEYSVFIPTTDGPIIVE